MTGVQTCALPISSGDLQLSLKPTVDILARLGARKGGRIIIAFALEVAHGERNAIEKMGRKRADAVVLNAPAAMGAGRSDALILTSDGERLELTDAPKRRIAGRIVKLAESLRSRSVKGTADA